MGSPPPRSGGLLRVYTATWGSAWLVRARHASPQATRPCSAAAFVWAIGFLDQDGSTFSLTVTGTLQRVYNQCGQIKWVNSRIRLVDSRGTVLIAWVEGLGNG